MDKQAELFQQLEKSLLIYDAEAAVKVAQAIVDAGLDVKGAIDVATTVINRIGDQFQVGDIFLPELMLAGEAMKQCMKVLALPLAASGGSQKRGKVVIGAVAGDIHDIGKNLVSTYLALRGFDVIDLGVNVPPMDFVEKAEQEKANIIALSSLMTTSMPYQRDVINFLREMGLRDKYYIVVGGGPVTPEVAVQAGADGWASNAVAAAIVCGRLMESGQRPPLLKPLMEE
jgi:methylmalonyl-CoA mutase cobalamin-binding domain/chain